MTDAFSVTEDIRAVPESNPKADRPSTRVNLPVPRELRQFFARVKEAVRKSKPRPRINT
jgi:hypothetical protein